MPVGTVAAQFKHPPVDYRPAPFTILHDEYPPGDGEAALTSILESMAQAGYGGAYLHPRPGLITEYLSPRWFELIRHCMRECNRLGIIPHLYDENSYPSGFSGGHVAGLVPEARCRFVSFKQGTGTGGLPGGLLSIHAWEGNRPATALEATELTDQTEWIAFYMQDLPALPWHGETVYPSLLDPRTTPAFIQTTHEIYRKELGDLWQSAPSIFTDEPHLPGSEQGPWSPGLHVTPYVLGQFRQRNGYDLADHLPALFFNVDGCEKVRYDYYDLCHQLWVTNWALPLEKWCQEHQIKLTGHYLEHDWPCPYATPGHMQLLAHMDWPGTDMLECFLLRGHDFFDVQGFEPMPAGSEPHGLFYLRQVHSLANQLGKERVVDESWGAGGHESAPEDWMRIGRWLIVHGVNLLIPHCTWHTMRGSRKGDHPQNFAPSSPWFKYLRPLNDELARLCWISNQGECVHRIVVIDSLTSGYCVARKADSHDPKAIAAITNGFDLSPELTLQSLLPIKQAANQFAQTLSDQQFDFDLADEYVIEEFGSDSQRSFTIGQRSYDVVVLIPGMNHLRSATVQRLRAYLDRGGRLLALRDMALLVDGTPSDVWNEWKSLFGVQIELFDTSVEIIDRLRTLAPPRLRWDAGAPTVGLAHMRRTIDSTEMFLIVNSSPQQLRSAVELVTLRNNATVLNPATGEQESPVVKRTTDGIRIELDLPAGGSTVILLDDSRHITPHIGSPAGTIDAGPVELLATERLADNVLVLDHCILETLNRKYPPLTVTAANAQYWKAHGFETNGWANVIQYRDQLLARDKAQLPDSGGTVTYTFDIAEGTDLARMRLAVEVPEVWQVTVNGQPVTFEAGVVFRDERFGCTDISRLVHIGRNEVSMHARPFSVRQEIDQIYILGNFACEPTDDGFRIVPARPIGWGSWKSSGLWFYDDELRYTVRLPSGTRSLSFDREHWGGAIVVAYEGGKEIGRTYESPWTIAIPADTAGIIDLHVVGLPKNLLGPWHNHPHRWGIASPWHWNGVGVSKTPEPGLRYNLLDLGLYRAPVALK